MITLNINNFRGFDNSPIDITDINILIGENSGGKTSLIKLLLLLKQSMETPNKDKKINVNGHLIDLGNFDSFINKNSKEKTFDITFKIDSEDYINYFEKFIRDDEELDEFVDRCRYFIKDEIILNFVFKKEDNDFFTNNITISCDSIGTLSFNIKEEDNHFTSMTEVISEINIEHKKYGNITISDKLNVYGFMLLATASPIEKYQKDNNLDNFFEEIGYLLISQNFIASFLRDIHYINPIKFHPTRIMLKRDNSFNGKINDFESLCNALSSLKQSHDPKSIQILNKFNNAVKELKIADEIKLETNSTIPVTELKVKKSNTWSSIVDVGYGVGLQVPILLQAIICSENDKQHTLIIEQPEIHLHPALHATFVEVLIKYAGNTRLIIETHSEHIIRKLQILVKKGFVDFEQTKIYYFKNDTGKFDITCHQILEEGNLQPTFPNGFYDNSYILARELY